MPSLLTNSELTALHTATLAAMNAEARTARTLTNITRRAETLLTTGGYTVETCRVKGLFYVAGPQGQEYQVNVGTALRNGCDCPAFAEYDTCKHYQAVDLMLRDEAQAAEYDALHADVDNGAYAEF